MLYYLPNVADESAARSHPVYQRLNGAPIDCMPVDRGPNEEPRGLLLAPQCAGGRQEDILLRPESDQVWIRFDWGYMGSRTPVDITQLERPGRLHAYTAMDALNRVWKCTTARSPRSLETVEVVYKVTADGQVLHRPDGAVEEELFAMAGEVIDDDSGVKKMDWDRAVVIATKALNYMYHLGPDEIEFLDQCKCNPFRKAFVFQVLGALADREATQDAKKN